MMLSDERSKEQISTLRAERDAMAKALGIQAASTRGLGAFDEETMQGLDDAALRRDREGTEVDLRPAEGFRYRYKNPDAPGADEGEHYGPMAQDLERTPAGRSVVRTGPDGTKMVDTGRLSLVNTAAVSEQQRRLDEIEALLGSARGQGALTESDVSATRRFMNPPPIDTEGLDAAYRRGQREGY